MATNDKAEVPREPIASLRDHPLGIPAQGQLRTRGPGQGQASGQLPTAAWPPQGQQAVCSQAQALIAGLAHVAEHCRHTGNEIERLLGELQGMIGKLPL